METFKHHKPGCMANISCLVLHYDGICPGPYGKCTCDQLPDDKPIEISNIDLTGDSTTTSDNALNLTN